MPDEFCAVLSQASNRGCRSFEAEEELLGTSHAEIGAYLLGLWGLPLRVTESIAYHHAPATVPHQRFDALSALYVANLLAHEAEGTPGDRKWDLKFLEGIGVASHVPAWKAMARELATAQQPAGARPN